MYKLCPINNIVLMEVYVHENMHMHYKFSQHKQAFRFICFFSFLEGCSILDYVVAGFFQVLKTLSTHD